MGLELGAGGGRMLVRETRGVGLVEGGLEGGRVQWLIMVEFVFEIS